MNHSRSDLKDTAHIPLRAILFGGDLPDLEMSAFRTEQIARISRMTLPLVVVIMFTALVIALQNVRHESAWMVGTYVLAVCAMLGFRISIRDVRREGWIHGTTGIARREIIMGLVSGTIMASPMIWFAYTGQVNSANMTWIILATLMAAYALMSAPVPLMFVAFMPPIALISAVSLTYLGNPLGAVAILALMGIAIAALITASRDLILFELIGRKAEERGETVSLLLREFEDTSADWLWQIDNNRRVTRASPRFAHAVGQEAETLEGMSVLQVLAGELWTTGKFPPAMHELANKLNRKESFSALMVPVTIDGRERWWELSASPTFDANGGFSGFRGVGSDVTEQRTSADRIAHLARFDGLTGLPNRLFINETLAGALEQAATWRRRCAFLMIDLDRFKAVNDTLGHPIGDRLLAQVASRLKQMCGDNIIGGRLGGDEFGVVLREVEDVEMVERIGKRIIDVISRPYEIDQHTLYVGASIGYAIGPRDGATVEALTRNADLALYRSKDRGGNVCNSYEPTLHDQARERRDIEIELRSALSRNEFEVHYQPVVGADGSVDGFEALLRWNSKKLGSVSPVRFIPVAEDTRLIGPIGEWVLRTACEEATRWPTSTKVAVNVSAEQLSSPGFVASVVSALAQSGLPPRRLELEVTESVFLREVSGAMATLDQVRGLGVRLSLDDFGTGYSSLGYLRMGQFSTIKVDRSFVQGALKGARESIAIIRAVVALADSLEMSTTAEGVETQEEADAIIALGCKKLQGYHFGRPMCATDARQIFAHSDTPRLRSVA
jgi:diguanylate cyclase (GGDEF)-like protein/PAS domain S-box-containing protein